MRWAPQTLQVKLIWRRAPSSCSVTIWEAHPQQYRSIVLYSVSAMLFEGQQARSALFAAPEIVVLVVVVLVSLVIVSDQNIGTHTYKV